MKRKKSHPEKFQRDKYQDGPKRPPGSKPHKSWDDDDDLDGALVEWSEMRKRSSTMGFEEEEE
jgi:hypothetical protein